MSDVFYSGYKQVSLIRVLATWLACNYDESEEINVKNSLALRKPLEHHFFFSFRPEF